MIPAADLAAFIEGELSQLRARPKQRAFADDEYAARQLKLRQRMAQEGLQLLIVSSPDAMCWLHGYQSRWYRTHASTAWPPLQCTVVHVDQSDLVHLDYVEHSDLLAETSVVGDVRLTDSEDLAGGLAFVVGELEALGWLGGPTGLEMWSSVPNRAVSEALQAALEDRGCVVRDASRAVRDVRRVKSAAEIATIEEAARVCDAGLLALKDGLRAGMTELDAWAVLVSGMAAAGGENAGLHECVYVGTNHVGHTLSSRRRIARGDLISADPCGVVNRYHANIARQFSLGEPRDEAVRLAQLEGGAYDVLRSVAKAGTPVREVNRTLRAYYEDAGVWDLRGWIGGYELGISFPPDWVGEWLFSVEDDDPEGVIEAGVVTNFESMTAFFMIDTVVFEDDGARTLSALPHELIVARG